MLKTSPPFALQNQFGAGCADDSNCFPKDIRDTLRPQGAGQTSAPSNGRRPARSVTIGNNSGNGNGAPVDVNTQDSLRLGRGCQMAKGGPAHSPVSSALMMTGMFSMLIFLAPAEKRDQVDERGILFQSFS
ncbi:MAG: hypothetical protein U1F57_09420 [bacterium]